VGHSLYSIYKLIGRVCIIYQKGDFKNAEETFKVPEK
jgi:hypothetical protein